MGSVSSPRALPIYIFTLAHGFIPLLDTPLCVPPWAKRPMIAHTYHNKEWTVLDLAHVSISKGIPKYARRIYCVEMAVLQPQHAAALSAPAQISQTMW